MNSVKASKKPKNFTPLGYMNGVPIPNKEARKARRGKLTPEMAEFLYWCQSQPDDQKPRGKK